MNNNVADNNVTDNNVTDNNVTDNNVTDNNVTDNHVTDNNVTDNHVTDNNVTDNHVTDNNVTDNNNCSICYETILLINLNCSHKICVECLSNLKKVLCPICRVELNYLPKKIKKIIYKNNSNHNNKNNFNHNDINSFNYYFNNDLLLEDFISQNIINNDNDNDNFDPSHIDKYFT
jgi:hypothetical protein